MTKTSTQIVLTFGEAELLSATSPSEHALSNVQNLVDGDSIRDVYGATLEPDQWLLDGNSKILPQPDSVGFVSSTVSLVDRTFSSNPEITFTLDAAVSIIEGLTLEFSEISDDYCDTVYVEFRNAASSVIHSETFNPDAYKYFYEPSSLPLAAIKFVYVRFTRTSRAYRHARLLGIFIDGIMFEGDEIETAKITEEINRISVELPFNTLDFELYSADGGFSIVDPQGIFASLKENQRIDVFEFVDYSPIFMGRFYLKDWDTKTDFFMDMSAVCAVGLTDEIDYLGTLTIGGGITSANAIIPSILTGTNIGYDIDVTTGAKFIQGWIPVTSARYGIRNTCFSVSGYASASRSKDIKILPLELAEDIVIHDYEFTNADIISPKINLVPFITDVIVNSYAQLFTTDANAPNIIDRTLANGSYTFIMDEPAQGVVVDGGLTTATYSITNQENYLLVTITAPGRLVVNRTSKLTNTATEFVKSDPLTPSTLQPKKKIVSNVFIMHEDYAQGVLDNVYAYYKERYVQTAEVIASEVSVGDSVSMPTPTSGFNISGIVERNEIDLTGGFLSRITVRGTIFGTRLITQDDDIIVTQDADYIVIR